MAIRKASLIDVAMLLLVIMAFKSLDDSTTSRTGELALIVNEVFVSVYATLGEEIELTRVKPEASKEVEFTVSSTQCN